MLLTNSHDHQILADNDLALEKFRCRLAPGVVADAVDSRGKVREHKRFDARPLSDATDIFGRRVVSLHMRHEGFEFHWPPLGDLAFDVFLDRRHVHRFVHQHVRTHVVLTQDWHPRGHLSFASSQGKQPFQTIDVAYGRQILWPDHCVQGTSGAEFHAGLRIPHAELVLRKGHHREVDSYSAFYENDRKTRTGLAGYLRERGFTRVFLAGLAFDFCVRYSAEDARREGFEAFVFEDACRSIDVEGSAAETRKQFKSLGIRCISAGDQ